MRQDNPAPAVGWNPSWWVYALLSLLLLVPCYWQTRLQAGDLSSHIYNSWLTQLIDSGRGEGLTIAGQSTNVLVDLILNRLFRSVGAGAAQHITVSLAVLIFAWGAFAFVAAVAGRRPWYLVPCIVMLAYGWVYHMGFFNFYLSLGLCFWGMALLWNWSPKRALLALPIFALAYVAHVLPLAWSVALMVYAAVVRRIPVGKRVYAMGGALVALVGLLAGLSSTLETAWSWRQIDFVTGLDQIWVFDSKYFVAVAGLMVVWGILALDMLRPGSVRQLLDSIPVHLVAISAAGVLLIPSAVLLPGYHMPLDFISQRMSLAVGVCICAVLGTVEPTRLVRYGMVGLAVLFFGFLYRDELALNSFEDQMQAAVAKLSPGQRVVSLIRSPDLRFNAVGHAIDRVCIDHCYSYANYEPSTGQFRVRAELPNPIVAYSFDQSWNLQLGTYVVQASDLPLYAVDLDVDGKMVIKNLQAGAPCGSTDFDPL